MSTVNLYHLPASPINFNLHTSGDVSPPEDLITAWISINPYVRADTLLDVFLYSDNDLTKFAYYRLNTSSKSEPQSARGLASILEVKNAQGELLSGTDFVSEADRINTLETIAPKNWIISSSQAQFIGIPKNLFHMYNGFSFASVFRIAFLFINVEANARVCVGDLLLVGGGKDESGAGAAEASRGGVQGTYRYRATFQNTTTGNRSNAGPVTQVAKDVNRGYVALSGLPVSVDPQVNAREIWRTMGDGTRYFKIATINDNTTTTFDDQVADYAGLDSAVGVDIMTTEELPIDNDVPFADHDQHIIDGLTAFWISATSTRAGRIYYSPIGRPESQKGYIDVSSAGDPLQRLVVFQGVRYAFSESKLYRISGDDPYVSFEISGVPGVTALARRTVVSTPYGICWQANDGIRIYNGSRSQLLNFDPIGKIFRGESGENLSAFEGTVAEFARGEYIVSSGTQTIACDIESGSWRHVGYADITSLFYEWDADVLQGGRTTQVELLEVEGAVTDAGTDIPIEWETSGAAMSQDEVIFVERLLIDVNTNSETLNPFLVHQYDTDTLATITNSSRTSFEREIQELVLRPSFRLTGDVGAQVTLYDAQLEYRPVVMGVNVEGADRSSIPGRWREDLGSAGRLVFEVDAPIKYLDQTDRLFVIDRVTIEADTEGVTVTPRIDLGGVTVVLAALSTSSSRIVNTYQIDRIGQLNELSLDGPFFTSGTRPKIYRVEVHVRELALALDVTTTGQSAMTPGRSSDPTTAIVFEVQPIHNMFDNLGSLYFIERLVIESDTNTVVVTPTIKIGGGTVTLATFSTTTRGYTEIDVERIGPIENLTLSADFTGDVQLFSIKMFVRPVELGIKFPNGDRMVVDGKAVASGTQIVFDIDPADRRFDAQSYVPLIERAYIDVDSASIDVETTLIMENQTTVLTAANTSARDTLIYNINQIGRLRSVNVAADFVTNAIKFYGIELQMRQLSMGVNVINNS